MKSGGRTSSTKCDTVAFNDNETDEQRHQHFQVNEFVHSNLSSNLDRRFTFENFIVGASNKLAYTASVSVANASEGTHFNVLYIYGAVGMGKTHLLQAIASQIALTGQRSAAYLSAEKFMHQYISSLKNNSSLGFREYLRSLDVFLIDDLQFICGKSSTQQEFSNTLNALSGSGKIVVVSCDRSPYQLDLDNRTKSRLAGGLVVEIKPADVALRCEILKAKAASMNLPLTNEMVEFIAQSITSNIRELEGAINNLSLYVLNLGMELNLSTIKEVLRNSLLAHEPNITLDKVINIVSNYYGVVQKDLLSKSRESKYVLPRQVIAFIAKQLTDHSLKDIGIALGKRDHATVIHSIKKLEERITADKTISDDIMKLIDMISSQ